MSHSKAEGERKNTAKRTILASGLGTYSGVPAETRLEFQRMADWKIQWLRLKGGSE
jgi:hypothetical protein